MACVLMLPCQVTNLGLATCYAICMPTLQHCNMLSKIYLTMHYVQHLQVLLTSIWRLRTVFVRRTNSSQTQFSS